MSAMVSKRHDSGYTMFELVMVMSIVAILASVALPGFKYVTTSNRIASEVNGLLGDMKFARSEAVKEGQSVTICPSADGANCSVSPNWESGWIVFLDSNGDQVRQASEAIIRIQPAFGGTDSFVASSPTFFGLTFNRIGYAPTGAANAINITLHDSTSNTNWTRCLAINSIGSTVTEKHGVGTPSCN